MLGGSLAAGGNAGEQCCVAETEEKSIAIF